MNEDKNLNPERLAFHIGEAGRYNAPEPLGFGWWFGNTLALLAVVGLGLLLWGLA